MDRHLLLRISLLTSLISSPIRHCCSALCSLSMGNIFTSFSLAALVIILPAATSVSLLANATSVPLLIAFKVGITPEKPTSEEIIRSVSDLLVICSNPSSPNSISPL